MAVVVSGGLAEEVEALDDFVLVSGNGVKII